MPRYYVKDIADVSPALRKQLQKITIPKGTMYDMLKNGIGFIVVARETKIGIVGWGILEGFDKVPIIGVCVSPKFRNRGIGTRIIKRMLKETCVTKVKLSPFNKYVPICKRIAEKIPNIIKVI